MRLELKEDGGIAPMCPVACRALLERISASWSGMPAVASLTVSMKLELWGRWLTPKSNLSPLRSMLPWSAPEPAKWNGSLGPFGSACMLAAAEALRFAWFCIACLLHWAASAVVVGVHSPVGARVAGGM